MVQVDDARRHEAAEADTEVHQHEVEAVGPLTVFGRDDPGEQRAARSPSGAAPRARVTRRR